MEATRSSKMQVLTSPTLRHIPEDGILRSYRRDNLKSYIMKIDRVPSKLRGLRHRSKHSRSGNVSVL
jgi:hypothetical protein